VEFDAPAARRNRLIISAASATKGAIERVVLRLARIQSHAQAHANRDTAGKADQPYPLSQFPEHVADDSLISS